MSFTQSSVLSPRPSAGRDEEASQPHPAPADGGRGHPQPTQRAEQRTKDTEQSVAPSICSLLLCSLFLAPNEQRLPREHGEGAAAAAHVIQCAVASTPAATGAGLASRLVLLHQPARAVFSWVSVRVSYYDWLNVSNVI